VLKDFHEFYSKDARVRRKLRSLAQRLMFTGSSLVVITPVRSLPPELRDEAVLVEMPLPDEAAVRGELDGAHLFQRRPGQAARTGQGQAGPGGARAGDSAAARWVVSHRRRSRKQLFWQQEVDPVWSPDEPQPHRTWSWQIARFGPGFAGVHPAGGSLLLSSGRYRRRQRKWVQLGDIMPAGRLRLGTDPASGRIALASDTDLAILDASLQMVASDRPGGERPQLAVLPAGLVACRRSDGQVSWFEAGTLAPPTSPPSPACSGPRPPPRSRLQWQSCWRASSTGSAQMWHSAAQRLPVPVPDPR
jgi:hypothetical protein